MFQKIPITSCPLCNSHDSQDFVQYSFLQKLGCLGLYWSVTGKSSLLLRLAAVRIKAPAPATMQCAWGAWMNVWWGKSTLHIYGQRNSSLWAQWKKFPFSSWEQKLILFLIISGGVLFYPLPSLKMLQNSLRRRVSPEEEIIHRILVSCPYEVLRVSGMKLTIWVWFFKVCFNHGTIENQVQTLILMFNLLGTCVSGQTANVL